MKTSSAPLGQTLLCPPPAPKLFSSSRYAAKRAKPTVCVAALQSSVVYASVPEGEQLWVSPPLPNQPRELQTNASFDPRPIEVEDARQRSAPFQLHEHGFTLAEFEAAEGLELDWTNQDEVKEKYYPLALQLVKEVSGATRVQSMEHIVRKGRAKSQPGKSRPDNPGVMEPSNGLHVDFTESSGPLRLQWAMPEEHEKLKDVPFAIVQVWRPIVGPVEESPLAFVPVDKVKQEDLIYGRLLYPEPGKESSFYSMKYNPGHEFYYYSKMQTTEAAVFKCYDSRTEGTARFTPHASFHDPTTSESAAERYSIEFRALAFFEDQS